jgi:hypothetical protein
MRARRLIRVTILALAAALVAPPSAAGGGWWSSITMDAPHVGAGETLTVTSEVLFDSVEAARAPVDFHAYLLRGVDERMLDRAMEDGEPGDWWTPPPGGVDVGDVTLSGFDSNLGTATARVTIPDVAPGDYSLMLCTAGCAAPLANVIPASVRVSSDAALAARVRALTARKWRQMHSLAIARRRLNVSRKRVFDLTQSLEVQTRRSEGLDDRVGELSAALQRRPSDGSGPEVGAALVAGLLLGGLGGTGLRRLRGLRSPVGASAEPAAAHR